MLASCGLPHLRFLTPIPRALSRLSFKCPPSTSPVNFTSILFHYLWAKCVSSWEGGVCACERACGCMCVRGWVDGCVYSNKKKIREREQEWRPLWRDYVEKGWNSYWNQMVYEAYSTDEPSPWQTIILNVMKQFFLHDILVLQMPPLRTTEYDLILVIKNQDCTLLYVVLHQFIYSI